MGLRPGSGAATLEGTMALPTSPDVVGGSDTRVDEQVGAVVAVPWGWPMVVIMQLLTLVPGGRELET